MPPTKDTGTTITFWADPTIFETINYSFETLSRRLQEMAFLNKGLSITLRDERVEEGQEPREVVYRYEGGIVDFVTHLNATKTPIHASVIAFEDKTEGLEVDIAMQWNESYSESVYTFANTINTHEGGTHEEGFRAALTTVVNKWARDKGHLKEKDDNLTGDDIREGLTAIVSVKLADPQFEGQTKTKLGNTEVKSFVQKACNEGVRDWFDRNPGEGRDIINKATRPPAPASPPGRRATSPAARACSTSARCRASWPTAVDRPGGQCELYIVEGDSAGGSAKCGRDSMFQAILPIRGKIINVEKARIDRVLQEHRGPGADHRAGHRHPRRVRPGQAALPQDRADGRRRRRRPAHPHAAADAAVPVHAPADRGRPRLPRAAAAVQDQVAAGRPGVRLLRPRARRPGRGRPAPPASGCPRRTRSSATRASAR